MLACSLMQLCSGATIRQLGGDQVAFDLRFRVWHITVMCKPVFIPHPGHYDIPLEEMRRRARSFARDLTRRRTVRDFSDRPLPKEMIEECFRTAG